MKLLMNKVKCINQGCGKILVAEDIMWKVRLVDAGGFETYAPACSEECASAAQKSCLIIHEKRVRSLKDQIFQKMKVKDFLKYS